jgi:thioredoxin reductase (NADPH)
MPVEHRQSPAPRAAESRMHDCLIIGAGPAGLSAATYLARYRRSVLCLEAGPSRAELIPRTHNLAGYPDGISGARLLERLREQAAVHGVTPVCARVETLRAIDGGFEAVADGRIERAARVILATGIVDKHPDFPGLQGATLDGVVRWCPICDGFEVLDQAVAVLGPARATMGHALFLRTYTARLALLALPDGPGEDGSGLDAEALARLESAGIELVVDPVVDIRAVDGGGAAEVEFAGGARRRFDAVYPMQGCAVQNGLALQLGARCEDGGDLVVDARQQTSVAGLYAIGDVVNTINQIGVGFGHAAIAATAVHRSLPRNFRAAGSPAPDPAP